MLTKHFLRCTRIPLVALTCAVLSAPLYAAGERVQPTLSGPSTARVSVLAKFTGAGFAPNTALSVAVTTPDANEAQYSTVSDAEGLMSHPLLPMAPGKHVLRVLDASGRVLATVTVYAAP